VVLVDCELYALAKEYEILTPFDYRNIQPASIDLTLSAAYLADDERRVADGVIELAPGDFILGSTVEEVYVPNGYAARVEGRSSWGRQGLLIHATAGFVDPGFRGTITLEMKNLTPNKVLQLPVETRICQITYLKTSRPAMYPYGDPTLNSHYQGQQGPTASAI
jgi:dCTP deaminase